MDNYFTHGVGLVFYFFVLWVFLQLAYASWGCKRASAKWTALVSTPFMQLIGIRWISAILVIVISLQIMLVVTMLGVSAYTGKPITFESRVTNIRDDTVVVHRGIPQNLVNRIQRGHER